MEKSMKFKLRFPEFELEKWAERNTGDLSALERIGKSARERGHLSRQEFLSICAEKSPRSKPRCASNSTELIEEVTRIAMSSKLEELHIRSLMMLTGVSWPTASYILHFCHSSKYPILDFRALWSLSIPKAPVYTYEFWGKYVEICRDLAKRNKLSMRQVDAALWQYSKERQK